jgi:putative ABC transport system permease protein
VSDAFAAKHVHQLLDQAVFVRTSFETPAEQAALLQKLAAYPQLKVQTAAQFKTAQKKQLTGFVNFVYVLLALSILIASFSVVNTMALSVIERKREIGLLRSIGMIRRQVRAMIRGEAVVVALFGAVLGLVLGVGLGAAFVHAASNSGINVLAIPVTTIIVVLILAALIGVLAAVFPARRAARLDVLQAIATA